ncbi:MAG: WecB/TagA/CpsF family glycosyltransferase [Candidatus Moraniibacteriota bacterium]
MNFFGIQLENRSRAEILTRVEQALSRGEKLRIMTVNPEFLLEARRNARFRESLKNADLRIVDGFGIVAVAKVLGEKLTRFPGADLLPLLLQKAEVKNIPVYLAMSSEGLSSFEAVREALLKKYPNLSIFSLTTGFLPPEKSFVLSNYGAPLQEYFLDQLPGGGVRMGVGGSFDYLTAPCRGLQRSYVHWVWSGSGGSCSSPSASSAFGMRLFCFPS